jgi:pimeloyl-ACP methyl ester carboxylesterase
VARRFSWRHQLRKFSRDYRVVAIDMRGYGESDKPRGLSSYVMDELVADLKSLIVELGYSSATMVAHDWGGAIAWRFAMKHPDLLDKLVQCNAPHPTVMAKILRSSMKQFLKSWYIFFFTCPFIPELWCSINDFAAIKKIFTDPPMGCTRKNALTEEDIEAYTYMFQKSGFTGPINYYRANSRFPKREEVEEINNPKMIDVPTLIIWYVKRGRGVNWPL